MYTSHSLSAGIYYSNTPTLSNLQQLPLQLDEHGNLRVTSLGGVSSSVSISDGPDTAHVTTDNELLTTNNSIGSATGGTAATKSALSGGVYNSTPLTLQNSQQAAIQLDSNGYLKVKVQALATDYPLTAHANEALFKRSYVLSHEMHLVDKNTTYNFIYIKTPPDSSKNVFINSISIGNVTSGNHATLTVYKNPTVTSLGVVLEPQSMFVETSQTDSALLCYNQTTLSGDGTKLMKLVCTNETNILDLNYGLLISPGNAILITANATSHNQYIVINVFFSEVDM
jgi:hypothetical protein